MLLRAAKSPVVSPKRLAMVLRASPDLTVYLVSVDAGLAGVPPAGAAAIAVALAAGGISAEVAAGAAAALVGISNFCPACNVAVAFRLLAAANSATFK